MAEGQKVRWRADTGFALRCRSCTWWWPLTTECWMTARGFARCRACYLELRRGRRVGMPAFRSAAAAARRRLSDNAAKAAKRRDPQTRPALLEARRQSQRRYYYGHRDSLLARRRERAAA